MRIPVLSLLCFEFEILNNRYVMQKPAAGKEIKKETMTHHSYFTQHNNMDVYKFSRLVVVVVVVVAVVVPTYPHIILDFQITASIFISIIIILNSSTLPPRFFFTNILK
jgi:hypothetical protein